MLSMCMKLHKLRQELWSSYCYLLGSYSLEIEFSLSSVRRTILFLSSSELLFIHLLPMCRYQKHCQTLARSML